MKNLYETINTQKEALKSFNPEVFEIPEYISNNLRYKFFDWQKEAMENLLYYDNPKSKLQITPTHLMFNMATGSGKTMLMAATILYYYNKGYRHFIFFVNQNNIIDKTENNFTDSTHTKYLYKEKIVIDDKTINIKKVETFSDIPQGVEIKFTTIQKLYNDIHIQKENQTTLDDLHTKDIVMLADEAHHLNANTTSKNGVQGELFATELKDNASASDVERKGWEHTVIDLILNKNGNNTHNKNVLLEFTATIPANEQVAKKYEDKIIAKFGLKEFLRAGYTKEINLISSTLDKKERILQALLFNWYRHKIALKNGIANFKPVILFRSKTIEESKADYEEFLTLVENISSDDFGFLKTIADKIYEAKEPSLFEIGRSRTEELLEFIKNCDIRYGEIAQFIKSSFSQKSVIITNSKDGTKTKEKTNDEQENLLNSLEDKNNHIRAIFTVDRLTEGWDVLNLFDIVRLYSGQNTGGSTKKTPQATTKEKQLIGRGVRYFPFSYKEKQKNRRKFDNDLKHELRILEELYYYTYDEESKYISHLKNELRCDGYIQDDKIIKTFSLKKEFKESKFYKESIVWYNEKLDNPGRKRKTLSDLKNDFSHRIKDFEISEEEMGSKENEDIERLHIKSEKTKTLILKFSDVEKHIFRKAINIKAKQENSLFQFEKLKNEIEINSIEDLQNSDILGDFEVKIIVNNNMNYDDISNKDKLGVVLKFLDRVFAELKDNIHPFKGSEFIQGSFKQFFSESKTKTIKEDSESIKIFKDSLENENWYVLDDFIGTSEEKELIRFIKDSIGNLESKYDEVYLLRNEEVYKIYDFKQGRGFAPDFILFLKGKDSLKYQIFIEPKGSEFIGASGTFKDGKEGWKEEFLEEISSRYGFSNVIKAEHPNYRLIGLPFFNIEHNSSFEELFREIIPQ
jgi:type III restriction enzyme